MRPASEYHIPEGLLAANTLLSEKPRLGFEQTETTVHQASIRLNYLNGNRVSSTLRWNVRQVSLMAQQQGLSSKSGKAIDKAAKKYGYDASVFKAAMTQASSQYKLNPNLLVGLGMRESSLNPSQPNGGLFQIQDPKAYGIDPKDIGNFEVQIPAAAAFLSGNISHFNGNVDLGVAAWTLGRGGTSHFFNEGGMPAVRGALLSAKHPDYGTVGGYIDFITSF